MSTSRTGAHYFESEPTTGSEPSSVDLVLPDVRLTLNTDRGVFARDQVDTGTKLLLLEGPGPSDGDGHLLDLGCGYGPIACTLAHRNPEATVWAVDVNRRARDLCRANAAAAGLDNVEVVDPDGVPADVILDRIWSNPPIRIGKQALHALLDQWLGRLGANGSAHLVVQRHLGADSLQRRLAGLGWQVTRRRSRKAFRLLDVAGADPAPSAAGDGDEA